MSASGGKQTPKNRTYTVDDIAAILGIGRTTLWRKMKQHGIDAGQFKRRV